LASTVTSEVQLQPILPVLLDFLPAQIIGRLNSSSSHTKACIESLRMQVLSRRGFNTSWTWRKAQAVEAALFCDPLANPSIWTPGPNWKGEGNSLESEGAPDQTDPWLLISGGTDWKGFQGGYRTISDEGVRPAWVAFRVRVATPELSGAFLTLASAKHTWGLADPILVFSYCGDEKAKSRRCFTVESAPSLESRTPHVCRGVAGAEYQAVSDKPYEVAIWLDWQREVMSVFIDGERQVDEVSFKGDNPIRFAAIYNWRSAARTAFSELILGETCPFTLSNDVLPRRSSSSKAGLQCPSRLRKAIAPSWSSILFKVALSSSALALFTAVAVQQLMPS